MTTIGLPKALYYYQHNAVWESFFRDMGCDVLISQDTNKEILDCGVKCCSNDTCLPVKVFHGHVESLRNKVDYVFVPRYTSLIKKEFTCPKFCGLPDMTALNLKNSANLLEVKLNLDAGLKETLVSLKELSSKLKLPLSKVEAAFLGALDFFQNRYTQQVSKDYQEQVYGGKKIIAVLGHPYMINDSYLNMKLLYKLRQRQINVVTPENIDYRTKRDKAEPFIGKEFWEIGLDNLGSASVYAKSGKINGIIYITPFACGIDSFVIEFIERNLKSINNIPFLKLTVDEHTGEMGFDTRLEAFLDMIG